MSILLSWLGPLRAICMAIDGVAYSLLDNAYNIVINLSTAELLKHDTVVQITRNLYILFGVVAFFRLAIVLVNSIIDPEKLNEKGKGLSNIFFRVVGMILILAVAPFLFKMSYDLQGKIVGADPTQNIIFKTILGDNSNIGGENAGKALQNIALSSLITIDNNYLVGDGAVCKYETDSDGNITNYDTFSNEGDCGFAPLVCKPNGDGTCTPQGGYIYDESVCDWKNCKNAVALYNQMYVAENMQPSKLAVYAGVSEKLDIDGTEEEVYVYDYMMIVTAGVGIFMTYIIISFAIDIAVRMFELLVLEILSPLFIATFVDPKSAQSGPFKNWLSAVGKSYASLYIKLAILALMIFLVSIINQSNIFNAMGDVGGIAKIFVVIGLLIFVKKAPKWLMDIIGIKGDESGLGGLSIGKKLGGMALAGGLATKVGHSLAGAGIGALRTAQAARRANRNNLKDEAKDRKSRFKQAYNGADGNRFKKVGSGLKSYFNPKQNLKNIGDTARAGLPGFAKGATKGIFSGWEASDMKDVNAKAKLNADAELKKYAPLYKTPTQKAQDWLGEKTDKFMEKSLGNPFEVQERKDNAEKIQKSIDRYGKVEYVTEKDEKTGEVKVSRNSMLCPVSSKEGIEMAEKMSEGREFKFNPTSTEGLSGALIAGRLEGGMLKGVKCEFVPGTNGQEVVYDGVKMKASEACQKSEIIKPYGAKELEVMAKEAAYTKASEYVNNQTKISESNKDATTAGIQMNELMKNINNSISGMGDDITKVFNTLKDSFNTQAKAQADLSAKLAEQASGKSVTESEINTLKEAVKEATETVNNTATTLKNQEGVNVSDIEGLLAANNTRIDAVSTVTVLEKTNENIRETVETSIKTEGDKSNFHVLDVTTGENFDFLSDPNKNEYGVNLLEKSLSKAKSDAEKLKPQKESEK